MANRLRSKARFLLFLSDEMNTLARRQSGHRHASSEIEALRAALDRKYAQMRSRAEAEWKRQHAGAEASDSCVRVRIR